MKRAQAATVLLVQPGGEPSPWAERIAEAGFTVQCVLEEGAAARLQGADAVAAVVLGPGLENPLVVARQVHRHAPLAHIVFLSAEAQLPKLKQALALAPLIGSHWTIASAEQDSVQGVLEDALRAANQRRQLRTTLDRINMRLAQAPPADSADYRKLVISDRFLASILNTAQDAIVSLDGQGRILTWNEGAKQLFGAGEADVTGQSLTVLADEAHKELLLSSLGRARAGAVARQETPLRRWSGDSFDAEVTVAPVRDEAGGLVAVSLIARDISARLEAQRELERLNSELERRVQERTVRLEEANRELESFAYSLSHDLRSPLSSISGFSQALLEDWGESMSGMARFYLERIQSNTRRMEELIGAMMMLSRIAQQPLSRSKLDFCKVARTILGDLQQSLNQQASFRCTVRHKAEGDPSLLYFALENLFNNAFKYRQKEGSLELELGSSDDGGEVSYFVKDNGIGFDMTYAGKIFEPFQRLHTSSDYPGTGIGLATVQRIIKRHGGRIWAEAEPGKGATFYFTLGASG